MESVISILNGHSINDVLVGGGFVVRDGKLIGVDEGELIEKLYDVIPEIHEKLNNIVR
ncbi:hypothetical protein [Vulcanisaeta sp. JCM 16161]|uniref:hypothetical protein n=1 Tax=Vulcanisaeta sp. JCM 16161 TaxID=1295372 RepID=UPI000AD0029A|nr:hypothetical protein [Vulcanisaeta sp. JCM 16161]